MKKKIVKRVKVVSNIEEVKNKTKNWQNYSIKLTLLLQNCLKKE